MHRALSFFILKPQLKIENSHIILHNPERPDEFTDAWMVIRNKGRAEAKGVQIEAKMNFFMPNSDLKETAWGDFETLITDSSGEFKPFDLIQDGKKSIKLFRAKKTDTKIVFQCVPNEADLFIPEIWVGCIYELLIRFVGKNFSDKKIWRILIDFRNEKLSLKLVNS